MDITEIAKAKVESQKIISPNNRHLEFREMYKIKSNFILDIVQIEDQFPKLLTIIRNIDGNIVHQ